jgi:hypothetical protein
MNNNPIVNFIKTAGAIQLTAKQIRPMLKEALGQDVPEDQIQNVLAAGAGAPPQPGGAGAPPPPGGPQGSMQASPMGGPGGPAGAGAGAPPDPSAGAPDAQAMIAALGAGGAPGGAPGGQADGSLIDPHELQALQQQHPQIDPMELQQIAEELAQYLATQDSGGAGGPPPSPDASGAPAGGTDALDVSAQGGPEGSAGGAMPKQSSLNEHKGLKMIKSASYIEGFLKSALASGRFDIPGAINFYGDALNNTVEQIKYAQDLEEISKSSAISDKTAAYCQGIVEEAGRRGLTFDQTVTLLKQSGVYEKLLAGMQSK